MYTLDTNTVIYYLDGEKEIVSLLNGAFDRKDRMFISTITELELFAFPLITHEETEEIERILQTVSIVLLDSQIARIAANIRRNHKIKTLDSAIAATAIFTGTALLTRNIRDFKKVPGLRVEKI